jgi:hypothetical protein
VYDLYDDEDEPEFSSPEKSKSGGFRRKITKGLTGVLILALLAAVLYLLSDRNSRTYFIVQQDKALVIKKGRFLPVGSTEYRTIDPQLSAAYAPIKMPGFATAQPEESFSERADLDQALASRLISWSRTLVGRDTAAAIRSAVSLMERVNLIPVTSVVQKRTLEELYREVAFFQGRESLRAAQGSLQESLSYFQRAKEAKSKKANRARHAVTVLKKMTKDLDQIVRIIDDPKLVLSAQTSSTSTTGP